MLTPYLELFSKKESNKTHSAATQMWEFHLEVVVRFKKRFFSVLISDGLRVENSKMEAFFRHPAKPKHPLSAIENSREKKSKNDLLIVPLAMKNRKESYPWFV